MLTWWGRYLVVGSVTVSSWTFASAEERDKVPDTELLEFLGSWEETDAQADDPSPVESLSFLDAVDFPRKKAKEVLEMPSQEDDPVSSETEFFRMMDPDYTGEER